jgi:hypothetical protein
MVINRVLLWVLFAFCLSLVMTAAIGLAMRTAPERRPGPVTDTEAACWATDLSPITREKLHCK